MPTNPIYPVVSDLLTLERIPSELEGQQEALDWVLGTSSRKGTIFKTSLNF